MAFFLPLLIGAGVGAAKNELIDRPAAEKKRRSQLTTLKFSPFTGRQTGPITQDPSTLGAAVKGAATGAAMGQNIDAAAGGKALQDAQIKYLGTKGNSFGALAKAPKEATTSVAPQISQAASPRGFEGSSVVENPDFEAEFRADDSFLNRSFRPDNIDAIKKKLLAEREAQAGSDAYNRDAVKFQRLRNIEQQRQFGDF